MDKMDSQGGEIEHDKHIVPGAVGRHGELPSDRSPTKFLTTTRKTS